MTDVTLQQRIASDVRRGRAAPATPSRAQPSIRGAPGIPHGLGAGVCSDTKDPAGRGVSRGSDRHSARFYCSVHRAGDRAGAIPVRQVRTRGTTMIPKAEAGGAKGTCSSMTTLRKARRAHRLRYWTCITGVGRKATRRWSGPRSWAMLYPPAAISNSLIRRGPTRCLSPRRSADASSIHSR